MTIQVRVRVRVRMRVRNNRHVDGTARSILVVVITIIVIIIIIVVVLAQPPPARRPLNLVAHAYETRFYVVGFEDHEAVAVIKG